MSKIDSKGLDFNVLKCLMASSDTDIMVHVYIGIMYITSSLCRGGGGEEGCNLKFLKKIDQNIFS